MHDIRTCAESLFAPGKGILAADESTHSADKRLAAFGIATGSDMRRKYRDLFLNTPGVEQYLSGVILHSETLDQKSADGVPFPELLYSKDVVPGIKVDEGTEPFEESPDELITNGLIGLPERLMNFRQTYRTGFTKWRAVITVDGDRLPTSRVIVENAKRLASYARAAQDAHMVPMVEPEVLMAGKHSRVRAKAVLTETLTSLFRCLEDQAIDRSGLILKTSMAVAGSQNARKDTPAEVAEDTVSVLLETVPKDVGGIVFLSGGQSPDQATENLAAISMRARMEQAPWPLTFSYARALQEEALAAWQGKDENVDTARHLFMKRLQAVSAASQAS